MATITGQTPETPAQDEILSAIERRVLWLATLIVHHANRVRPNPEAMKIGGHQASSASLVSVMTALYFEYLRAGDRVSVKPHASPVYHAIQYLLGNLDRSYLTTLRAFHGLQAYPSRAKDPDPPDFSTGSVGLGAVAPNFAALVERYVVAHFGDEGTTLRRYVSLVGDAELDEGSIWEAVAEPALAGINNVLWIVDLNRQSLDRIVPGIRAQRLKEMFAVNGWHVIDLKYGEQLHQAFAKPGGELLRRRIDEMPNEEYQRLLRVPATVLRQALSEGSPDPEAMRRFLNDWDDQQLPRLYSNLAGHDLRSLRSAFREADATSDQPSVIFAYTIKGWGLPFAGDPLNHSAYLTDAQMETLRIELGVPPEREYDRFPLDSPEGRYCSTVAARLTPPSYTPAPAVLPPVPATLGHPYRGRVSTQDALGRILTDLARDTPELAKRIVTASPDVATSTNLAGWINRVGVFSVSDRTDYFSDTPQRMLRWHETQHGQHIELGISENNLFLLLGQLGIEREVSGEILLPLGTLYDPFVCRGLDSFIYSVYNGGRFIVAGTPSGITLSPEGGAHQSVITPSIGLELPGVAFYEPAFAQEVEWILLAALGDLAQPGPGDSYYLRLTTRTLDQSLISLPDDPEQREQLRRQVIAGGYRLRDHRQQADYRPGQNVVNLLATGAVVPEALAAADALLDEGIYANLINVTSADLLYRRHQTALQQAMGAARGSATYPFTDLISAEERRAPVVTVQDGHPHTLAWLGGALGVRCLPLGVSQFGQSGSRADLYSEYCLSPHAILDACLVALET